MEKNREYVKSMLEKNDVVIIDTASLMESDAFARFIDNYEDLIRNAGRLITVPNSVYQELVRHLIVGPVDKQDKAKNATQLLRSYNELFTVEREAECFESINKSFADRDILVKLSEGMQKSRQMLITNDRGLAKDAYGLNNLESCHGQYISVCYINGKGELHRCECTNTRESKVTNDIEPKTVTKTVYYDRPESAPQKSRWKIATVVGACVVSFVAGVYCNHNEII